MNFIERYNLKEIPVAGYILKQRSPTYWHSGNIHDTDLISVFWSDNLQTFSVCIERGQMGLQSNEWVEFRAKTLPRALHLANTFLRDGLP